MGRRPFLGRVGAALAILGSDPNFIIRTRPRSSRIRAIAFDGYAVFDATTVLRVADEVVPGHGRELLGAWRTRLFEYQWLRTLGGRYLDFRQTAADALMFATTSLRVSIGDAERSALLEAQLRLEPWPDAAEMIRALREAGLRLAFLSNMTEAMLDDGARRGGFRDAVEHVLSTDRVRAVKPDPRAYRMAIDAFGLPREEIAFVAFAGWDAAGATWFGYPTVWTNRLSAPAEELGAAPAVVGRDLGDVIRFVTASS